jgi:hypothetical protein
LSSFSAVSFSLPPLAVVCVSLQRLGSTSAFTGVFLC